MEKKKGGVSRIETVYLWKLIKMCHKAQFKFPNCQLWT